MADLLSGLIGWWKLDEGAGVSANDASVGSLHDGTISGAAWAAVAGRNSLCLQFDGTDDAVDCGAASTLQPTAGLSVAAWVRRNGTIGSFKGLFSSRKNSAGDGGYLLTGHNVSPNRLRWYIDSTGSGGWSLVETDAAIPDLTWVHVVGTWDGANMRLYIDGAQQSTVTARNNIAYAASPTTNHKIGDYLAGFWNGWIDDVRIYDRALTVAEVGELMLAGAHRHTLRVQDGMGSVVHVQ